MRNTFVSSYSGDFLFGTVHRTSWHICTSHAGRACICSVSLIINSLTFTIYGDIWWISEIFLTFKRSMYKGVPYFKWTIICVVKFYILLENITSFQSFSLLIQNDCWFFFFIKLTFLLTISFNSKCFESRQQSCL